MLVECYSFFNRSKTVRDKQKRYGTLGAVTAAALLFYGSTIAHALDEKWPLLQSNVNLGAGSPPLPESIEVTESQQGNTSKLQFAVSVDLTPIKSNLDNVFQLPVDSCRNSSAMNAVARVDQSEFSTVDGKLNVKLNGQGSVWLCMIPVPKVEWQEKSVGLGIKTRVPVVTTGSGLPVKTKMNTKEYQASSTFQFVKSSAGDVQIEENNTDFGDDPLIADVIRKGGTKLANLLQSAGSPKNLFAFLPDASSSELNFQIVDAGFKTVDGKHIVTVKLSTTLPRDNAALLKQKFIAAQIR